MWKKVKNLDLFIRVVDTDTNMYVCYPPQYHRDYMSFTLTFSFEDWSNFYSDGKRHIEITAKYINSKGQYLVKFQDTDFDKLCEKVKIWNESHRVELIADIVTKICAEQNSKQNEVDIVPADEPQQVVDTDNIGIDESDNKALFVDLLHWVCNLVVKPFIKNK